MKKTIFVEVLLNSAWYFIYFEIMRMRFCIVDLGHFGPYIMTHAHAKNQLNRIINKRIRTELVYVCS